MSSALLYPGRRAIALAGAVLALGCGRGDTRPDSSNANARGEAPCPASELTLPQGFCATVFADSVGHARHMAVASNGTVYLNTWSGEYYGKDKPPPGGFLVALRDTTGDGRADVIARFGDSVQSGSRGGTGLRIYRNELYAEQNDKILRYRLSDGSIRPAGKREIVVQ